MYMQTAPNLDSWSTDNCCVKWSLRTGALTIAVLSMVSNDCNVNIIVILLPTSRDRIICSKNKLTLKVVSFAYNTVWKLTNNYRQLIFRAYNPVFTYYK